MNVGHALDRPLMRTLERTTIVAGILLLLAWTVVRIDGAVESRKAIERFDETVAVNASSTAIAPPREIDMSLWSSGRVEAYQSSRPEDAGSIVGVLTIPAVGLEVPVLEGVSEITLNRGAGHIPGTALVSETGNIGIAGHRDGFFRALKDVEPGDVVELRAAEGPRTFVIESTTIVEPDDVSVLAPTDGTALTLVTCYPFYYVGPAPHRFIVRAVPDVPPDIPMDSASRARPATTTP